MVADAAYWHGRYVQEFETARKWQGVDFDEYVVNHRRPLLRLAYLLTGDAHHAEDIVQTALLRAFRHWRQVTRADHPDAYVRRMVVNAFPDGRRRRSVSEKPTATGEMPVGAERDHADTYAERAATWAKLAELPRAQRAILVLRFYEDLDDASIDSASSPRHHGKQR